MEAARGVIDKMSTNEIIRRAAVWRVACIFTQLFEVPQRGVPRIERNLQSKIFHVTEQNARRRLMGQHFHSFVSVQESQREERGVGSEFTEGPAAHRR
jgi:hypothetical protein